MYTSDLRSRQPATHIDEGLYTIEAEFYTDHLIIHGEIVSPNLRLSDYLNSSLAGVEIRPLAVQRVASGAAVDLPKAQAHIYKAHLLFIVPLDEPSRPDRENNAAWTRTTTRRCWAGLGRYSIDGQIHEEAGRDTRLILRSFEHRQFIPLTEATVTLPEGGGRSCRAIIVNQSALEMIAIRES
ncbi:MAG: hypothetical protein ACR2JC_17755 [Chloroflexota bacterium]|nr:MAG: hypothetical protein DLM70_18865 [Chloroflexota bacterium]